MSNFKSIDLVLKGIDPQGPIGTEFQISAWLWPPLWAQLGAFGGISPTSPVDMKTLMEGMLPQPGFTIMGGIHKTILAILEKAQKDPKMIDAAQRGYASVNDFSKMFPQLSGVAKPAFDAQQYVAKLGQFIEFLRNNSGFRYDGAPNKAGETIFCVKCGTPNNKSANFCLKCGAPLVRPPDRPSSSPSPSPDATSNLRLQSEMLLVQGRFQEALTLMEQLIPQLSNDASFWNNRGAAQAKLGQHEEALKSFDRALQVDPRHTNALLSKSLAFANLGRFNEAIACCDKIIEFSPKFAMAWMNKGNFFGLTGKLEESLVCFRKAMNYDIKNPNAWYGLAMAYKATGNHEAADLAMKHALELGWRPNL